MNMIHRFEDFAESVIQSKGQLIFYGAAEEGRYLQNILKTAGLSPSYFCDKSVDLIGKTVLGIPVISPGEIDDLDVESAHVLVTTTSFHHDAILKGLENVKTNLVIHLASNIKIGQIEIVADTSSWLRENQNLVEIINENNPEYHSSKEKYIQEVFFPPKTQIVENKIMQMDYASELVNIINGKRITKWKSDNVSVTNQLHLFGDSRILGMGVDDAHTLTSTLQNVVSQSDSWSKYSVINHSVLGCSLSNMIKILKSSQLNKGDIVIFTGGRYDTLLGEVGSLALYEDARLFFEFLKQAHSYLKTLDVHFIYLYLPRVFEVLDKSAHEQYLSSCYWTPKFLREEESMHDKERKEVLSELCKNFGIAFVDATENFQRPHPFGEVYLDTTHFSVNGMVLLSETIFNYMEKHKDFLHMEFAQKYMDLMDIIFRNEEKQIKKQQLLNDAQLTAYIEKLKSVSEGKPDNAGIIIVNCNPFTKGHQYLIRESAKKVSHLYVLVLEEDKSYFKFKDRIELVRQGTKDIDNVTVVESGKYIISSFTMPEYFDKDNLQDKKLDAALDIKIFTTYIAPALRVVKRFVGEEPFCKITAQYNEQMNDILPQYGIELEIIPRIATDGKAISATSVRNCIKENDIETLHKLLPDTTLKFLYDQKMII